MTGAILVQRIESLAPVEVFGRLLMWQREIGLTEEQVDQFLLLKKDYDRKYMSLLARAQVVAVDFEGLIAEPTVDRKLVNARIREHAKIMEESGRLIADAAIRMSSILTERQRNRYIELTLADRAEYYRSLKGTFSSVFDPFFKLVDS